MTGIIILKICLSFVNRMLLQIKKPLIAQRLYIYLRGFLN